MNKSEFLTKIQATEGFVAVISDTKTDDSPKEGTVEKRVLSVQHGNKNGTAGITSVYYLHDTSKDEVTFYNDEPKSFQRDAEGNTEKALKQLEAHLLGKYQAYFITRQDPKARWVEALVYATSDAKLAKKTVIVKQAADKTITDTEVV